ncbi:GGDEF domain-containing protein [Szabonella alba]|uniref:GGDEF domain-containing protein n=1 Tax=Szabonella alba TaxID=2804194 RepID=A0A8K0VAW0_9RHOB|nr:GGDEF domain-containing protein [Szabonella alba]MBL4915882.1 GGDEF domain-containing protein [Szabonella alba]
MPMHLYLSAGGTILSAGPTIARLYGKNGLIGLDFFATFEIRRPVGISGPADLARVAGARLIMLPLQTDGLSLRGVALPLAGAGGGMLLNLSFGIGVVEAVAHYRLTDADFAVTDLAMELLYLMEAKAAVTDELRQLNLRLQGARDAAEEQALTDTLTGLRNRRALDMTLDRVIAEGQSFGLMHIDLDYFKAVNDTYGHAAGDHVLREVGQALMSETRKMDTVARVGGDEFVIVFKDLADPGRLSRIADRIVARLSLPISFEDHSCMISASIGISISTDYDPPDPERMLDDADQALYASKKAGRGRAQLHHPAPRGDGDPCLN